MISFQWFNVECPRRTNSCFFCSRHVKDTIAEGAPKECHTFVAVRVVGFYGTLSRELLVYRTVLSRERDKRDIQKSFSVDVWKKSSSTYSLEYLHTSIQYQSSYERFLTRDRTKNNLKKIQSDRGVIHLRIDRRPASSLLYWYTQRKTIQNNNNNNNNSIH